MHPTFCFRRPTLALAVGCAALLLLVSGRPARAAAIAWTNTAGGNWSAAANWSPNQVPGAADDASIYAPGVYTVVLNANATVRSLTLGGATSQPTLTNYNQTLTFTNASAVNAGGILAWGGGSLVGTNLTVNGQFLWNNGTVFNPLTIATNGVLNIVGGPVSLAGPLTNAGTVNWTAGTFYLYSCSQNAGPIVNLAGAQWNINCDQALNPYCATPAGAYFQNAGTVTKSGTTGITSIGVPFNNTGTLTASAGSLKFEGGGALGGVFSAAGGTAIQFDGGNFSSTGMVANGPGTVQLTGGTLLLFTDQITNLGLVGGTVSVGPVFQGGAITNLTLAGSNLGGTNTVAGTLSLGGGNLPGALTVTANGMLNLTGGTLYVEGTITNAGTVNWTGGNIYLFSCSQNAGPIVNAAGASWNIYCDQSINPYCATPVSAFFQNAGVVRKWANNNGGSVFGVPFNNSGTVISLAGTINLTAGGVLGGGFTAPLGTSIQFAAGSFSSAGMVVNGSGAVQLTGGTLLLTADQVPNLGCVGGSVVLGAGFQGGAITNLTLAGSTLGGTNTVTGTLNLAGGTLTGALTVAGSGGLNITGGPLYLQGTLTNAGTVNWTGGIIYLFSCSQNAGPIVNLAGGQWNIACDQPITTYCSSPPVAFFQNAGTVLKSVTTGTSTISAPFYNSGTVSALTGTLNCNVGGVLGGGFSAAGGAAIQFNGGNFSVAGMTASGPGTVQFTAGNLLLGGDQVANLGLTGGTVLLGPGFQGGAITNLTLAGSTLGGTNTVAGTLNLAGGSSVSGALTVAGSGVLNVTSGAIYLSGTITNAGTVNWTGGTIYLFSCSQNAGPIVNLAGGLWNIACDQSMGSYCSTPASAYFQNAGTVRKSVTAGSTTFGVPFNSSGTVTTLTGTLNLNAGGVLGGNFNAAAGSTIQFNAGNFSAAGLVVNGPGAVQLTSGGTLLLANDQVPNLGLLGGTVLLGAGFQGGAITNLTLAGSTLGGTNTVAGTLAVTGGTVSGPLTVAANGVLNLAGASLGGPLLVAGTGVVNITGGTLYLAGTFTNAGMVNWTGGNILLNSCGQNAGPIVNLAGAQWNITCDQSMGANCAYPASAYFQNAGTVRKSVTTGTTSIGVPFNNSGVVTAMTGIINFNYGGVLGGGFNAAGGALIQFNGGNFSVAGVVANGPGAVQLTGGGTLFLVNDVVPNLGLIGGTVVLGTGFQGGTITNLSLGGTTLAGTNTVTGTLSLAGGPVSGPLTVAANAVLNLAGASLGGSLLVAGNGVVNITGGTVYLAGTLTNAGTVNWAGGNILLNSCGQNAGPIVNLAGALWNMVCDQTMGVNCAAPASAYFQNSGTVRKSVTTAVTSISVPFNNSGTVTVLSGSINFNDGGVLGGGFSAAGGTLIQFNGGNFSVAGVVVAGPGTVQLNGSGTLQLLNDVVPNLNLFGGTVVLGPGFQGGAITNLTLAGTTLAGTNTVTGTFNLAGGTVSGPLMVAGSGVFNLAGGTLGATLTIVTNGTFNLTSGNLYLAGALTNAGTVNWTGGGILLNSCGQNAGPIVNSLGALWNIACDQSLGTYCTTPASAYFLNAGTVRKTAGLGFTTISVPFNNAGLLDTQSGAFNFNLTPGYVQTGATLNFGLSSNGHSGALNISGTANFDGTLSVNLLNGYTPQAGDSFTLVNYGSPAGSFQSLALGGLVAGLDWKVSYTAGALVLQVMSNSAAAGQLTGTVQNPQGQGLPQLTVFAYTTNVPGLYVSTTTDAAGNYSLGVSGGNWLVGIQNAAGQGFNPPANQPVLVTAPILSATNLLLNPGAEAGTLANWTVGGVSSLRADNGAFDPGINPHLGAYDFAGGTGATGSLAQVVTLLGSQGLTAAMVDNGGAVAMISFWEQGLNSGTPSDDAYVRLAFWNSASNVIGGLTSPEIDSHGGAWSNYAAIVPVPAGTRYLQYVMNFVRHSGNDLDAFVDDNSLSVAPTNTPQVVNFVLQPYTGPVYSITTAVNPPGAGSAGGGGAFAPGAIATLGAVANTNLLPYVFTNWTENTQVQAGTTNYAFTVTRNRQLVANFILPLFTVTAGNNPAGAGNVTGAGTYFYGNTSLLTAYPIFGYSFTNWTEGTNIVGTNATLSTVIYTNHAFTANYNAANLLHAVATATAPAGIAPVAGAGLYTNGQMAFFSAPALVTNPPNYYLFRQFSLSNTVAGTNTTLAKTFSTLDPTNLQYVAVYATLPILPQLTNVLANLGNPVPATTNFVLTLEFDRTMATNVAPLVRLTNSAAALQAVVPANGSWSTRALTNDTYVTPPITFLAGMDGTQQLWVSAAQDGFGNLLPATNAASFLVEATPPPIPVLSLVSSNNSSVTVGWSGYPAPADLGGFRLFIAPTNYSSVTAVPIYSAAGAGARSFTFGGLALDTAYYLAVQAYDTAGNSYPMVTTLRVLLPTALPPPVGLQVASLGASTAALSWNSYAGSALPGFSGFRVFVAPTNFTTVAGLTPLSTLLPAWQTTFQVPGLDRTLTYYFAVVGYNATNGFNPVVAAAGWSDPYAGAITANTTIGVAGPSTVNIYQSIVVTNSAVLTITPGTTLLFNPGTSLTVAQGQLQANGTALAPIIFDSANDTPGNTPAPGDWGGVTLGSGAGASSLNFVEIFYGGGLTISGCAPTVQAFTAANNTAGLLLNHGSVLNTTAALLAGNGLGLAQWDTAALTLRNSVVLNNATNAWNAGASALTVTSNYWGSASAGDFTPLFQGAVTYTPFLTYEPLLTPAVATASGGAQVSSPAVPLVLACRTADAMRLSENINFSGVFFAPFTNANTFALSPGGGLKRIYAQFRSVTGFTNPPLELDVNYVTGGPAIQTFSISQGQMLSRPLTVTGTATSGLGILDVELYVDGVLIGTNAGGSLSQYLDVRTLANATHELQLLARDTHGQIASLQNEVVVAVTPPPAPVLLAPVAGLVTNVNVLPIQGTAEPNIPLQITRNGIVLALTNADGSGNFTLANTPLAEGDNLLLAIAADSTGTTPSAARHVLVETVPPAQLVLSPPLYTPGSGLALNWSLPAGGKPSVTFQIFWATHSFTATNQATGHTIPLTTYFSTLQALANGTYYFGVVGYDAAGNPSPLSSLVTAVYDATPPVLSVAYGTPSPVGPQLLNVTLSSSKALASTPSLTIQPAGAPSPVLLSLTNVALNTWQTVFPVTSATPSGPATVRASGQDAAGNSFNGPPNGPALVIDTTPPVAAIVTVPAGPVQTTNSTNVTITLVLSKPVGAGLPPALSFTPPVGASVPIPLIGAGSNWNGGLLVTPAMGTGLGRFAFSAQDAVGNVGTNIAAGAQLELYNAALPPAPAAPTNLAATSLPGGLVSLTWNAVGNAQIYRLYRVAGTNFTLPPTLVLDNLGSNHVEDLPPVDGLYAYGISAGRFGSESGVSNVVVGLSDRTPPAAPTNVLAALAPSGVRLTWQEPAGATPDHYAIYRNGLLIAYSATVTPQVDYPPKGTNSYVVAAVDAVGNQNAGAPATLVLLVGPVGNLSVVLTPGQAAVLNWTATDGQTVGYNLYRNGVKQNPSLLVTPAYTDTLPVSDLTQYGVTAVNGSGQESPARVVGVFPVGLGLLVNSAGSGTNNAVAKDYFDQYQVRCTNFASGAGLPLAQVQLTRAIAGLTSLVVTQALATNLAPAAFVQSAFTTPEPSQSATQMVTLAVSQLTDSGGSSVTYQQDFTFAPALLAVPEITVSANQSPLAGGLSTFQVQVFNRSYVDVEFIVERGSGAQPGDFYISVQNNLGQEVSRTPFQGTPPGTTFLPNGIAYVKIAAGGSLSFNVPNVLVPAALAGSSNVVFQAVAGTIYSQYNTPNQVAGGPISGAMTVGSLAQPAYTGTAQTDQATYANDQPVQISGQAVSTATGLPVPNAALNLGFFARGFKWYLPVTTDANGNYQYTYHPTAGLGGTVTIWAANPSVVDQLNQAQIIIYRLYCNPASGDITMSKNDSLNFSVQLINPGDVPLTGFTYSFSAYQMSGTNQVPVATVTGTNTAGAGLVVAPNGRQTVGLQLSAAINAPNTVMVVFTFTAAGGATATFTGITTLLPAVPALTVVSPVNGYLEVSVNRGGQLSGQVTVQNTGLRALQGVTLTPPTNLTWMQVNLPVSADGLIHLPDLAVGASNTFTVVFSPPANTALAFDQDSLTIQGTNFAAVFPVNLYALVTSDLYGGVQFFVDDILGQPVPNAAVVLHNNVLFNQPATVYTDTNGMVTVTNLQEGAWNWQVSASGCSGSGGTVNVAGGQTAYQHTRLSRSLVTVTFNVVPVPFTDQYTIQVEQTFQTHVQAPVLVLDPPAVNFHNVSPGFAADFTVNAQNYGLIKMTDVVISGQQVNGLQLTPLITYIPVLLPLQTVAIPFTLTYNPAGPGASPGGGLASRQGTGDDVAGCFSGSSFLSADALLGIAALLKGASECYTDAQLQQAVALLGATVGVALAAGAVGAIGGEIAGQAAIEFLASAIGCAIGYLIPLGGDGGNGPGGGANAPGSIPEYGAGKGCFAGNTLVLMADGSRMPISALHTNDVVRTGVHLSDLALVKAVHVVSIPNGRQLELRPLNGAGLPPLVTTPDHALWVDGRGWVAAGNVAVGDWLVNERGERITVTSNSPVGLSEQVYSLSLLGDNVFYADGVLVRDACGTLLVPSSPIPAVSVNHLTEVAK